MQADGPDNLLKQPEENDETAQPVETDLRGTHSLHGPGNFLDEPEQTMRPHSQPTDSPCALRRTATIWGKPGQTMTPYSQPKRA